jgi:hypothetical protein
MLYRVLLGTSFNSFTSRMLYTTSHHHSRGIFPTKFEENLTKGSPLVFILYQRGQLPRIKFADCIISKWV